MQAREKDNLFLSEFLVSIGIFVVLFALINPFPFPVPQSIFKLLALELVVNYGLFASFIMRERARDEVASFRGMLAGKIGYLTGAGILVWGIAVQTFKQDLDQWLVAALGGMVLLKIVALVYGKSEK